MKLIERKQYLDKMIGVIGTPDIKVLTGVRRSGKSKLLEAIKASGKFLPWQVVTISTDGKIIEE